jgi:hypothetical protein
MNIILYSFYILFLSRQKPGCYVKIMYVYLRLLQKSEKSFSVIVSLSNYDHKSNGYITLRQAQGDNSGVLQEPLMLKFKKCL